MPKNRVCANSAALPRRTFLTGAAASPLLCASPALAKTGVDTELERTTYERGFMEGQRRILDVVQNLVDQRGTSKGNGVVTPEMWDLFDQWMTDRANLNLISIRDDEKFDRHFEKIQELQSLIFARTPITGTDMLIKIVTYTDFVDFDLSKGLLVEAVAFLGLAQDPRAMVQTG